MLDVKLKLKPGHDDARDWMAPAPIRVLFWNATRACNFRCRLCYACAGAPEEAELDTGEVRTVLRDAAAAGVKDLVVSGGEPFLRPDLLELLAEAKRLGLGSRVASNGSLIDEALLQRLRAGTAVRSFMISLDSLDPAVYSNLHGVPAAMQRRVLQAIALVRDRGFHTTVAARVTPDTLPGLPALLEYAAAEDWATLTLLFPVEAGRADTGWPPDTDLLSLLDPVFERYLALPHRWQVETCIPWARYHPSIRRLETRTRVAHVGCGAGRTSLVLEPAGWLTPCLCLDTPDARLGNVRETGFARLIADAPVLRLMRAPMAHGICADCGDASACGGGCRAMARAATGRLSGEDPACPVRRRKRAHAFSGPAA